jgi:Probable zinc-ribbon domain
MSKKTKKPRHRAPLRSRETLERLARVVPHPRFGTEIKPSGLVGPDDVIPEPREWSKDVIFPESAIPADHSKQNYTTMSHVHWYVDTLRDCRVCRRPFLFFAREQQHWYETLRFRLEVECYECVECRASLRTVRRRLLRYGELVGKRKLLDGDLLLLAGDVAFLWKKGLLQNEQRLREIRNRALRQVPDCGATQALDELVASLPKQTHGPSM